MTNLGDDDGGGVPLWLIIYTVSCYIGFFIAFGNALPGFSTNCNDALSCAEGIWGIIVSFFTVLTLGGFASPLPAIVQGILLLILGFGWVPIFIKWITAIIQALLTGVP